MSKYKWKRLPNWRDESEYSFLNDAPLAAWAWEFLRRNPEYKEDWDRAHGSKNKKYSPLIKKGDVRYKAIVEADLCCIEGAPARLAKKWGLRFMASPDEPLPKRNLFALYNGFPRLIKSYDDLEPLMVGEDFEHDDGSGAECVIHPVSDKAIIVFDLTMPLDKQFDTACSELLQMQKNFIGKKVVDGDTSGHKSLWVRHLRALDARRTTPAGKYREISEILGGSISEGYTHKKRGEDFFGSAQGQMKHYKKILLHSSGQ